MAGEGFDRVGATPALVGAAADARLRFLPERGVRGAGQGGTGRCGGF